MNARVAGRALAISIIHEASPNLSQREVAEKLGVSRKTVSLTLLRTGTPWLRGREAYVRHVPLKHALRDVAIVEEARETGRSLQAIGQDYGITRERVRQILKRAGVKKAYAVRQNHYSHCSSCGKVRSTYREGRCKSCSKAVWVTLPCSWCGAPVTRTLALAQGHMRVTGRDTTQFFCNHRCHGRWFGHNYGVQKGGPGRHRAKVKAKVKAKDD